MRKWWKYALGGVAAGVAFGYYMTHVEPTWLKIKRVKIPIKGLPKEFDGFKIVQLSDFHYIYRRNLPSAFLQEVVDQVAFLQPSLIALTGDFVHDHRQVNLDAGFLATYLAKLEAPFGKFAVLGNHDYAFFHHGFVDSKPDSVDQLVNCLREAGITVLRNQSLRIRKENAILQLAGLDDLDSGYFDAREAMHTINPNLPAIVLVHNPDAIVHFWRRYRVDLMLCGHTHGGQVKLPFINVPRTIRHPWRMRGHHFEEGIHVYINRGIGWGKWRMRFNARPEITCLTLKTE